MFISDLTDKATGATLAILIVLYVGSQLLSTLLMSTTTDKTQRMIFLALPFIFVLFVIQFPAGLLVYWITTNVLDDRAAGDHQEAPGSAASPAAGGREAARVVRRLQTGEHDHRGRAREEEGAEGARRGAEGQARRPATEVTP